MKSHFSKSWVSSGQPRKQHKYLANAPLHIMHKFLSANLSKALRELHGKRSLPLKTGDEVLVMRGKFKKKSAKVASVDLKKRFAYLEGIQRTKREGTKVNIPFHPSILQITSLNLEDKRRLSPNTTKKTITKGEKHAPNKA
ncbi:MAG: 50S ribosomal protein L24 [Nanoarchaeota archaeon]|nr:50S ribosomal protein L24 [Nanoarchaeota archaeon]